MKVCETVWPSAQGLRTCETYLWEIVSVFICFVPCFEGDPGKVAEGKPPSKYLQHIMRYILRYLAVVYGFLNVLGSGLDVVSVF